MVDAKSVFPWNVSQGETRLRLIYARALLLKIRDARLFFAQLGDFRTTRSMTDVIFYPHPIRQIKVSARFRRQRERKKREERERETEKRAIHEVDNPRRRVIPSQRDAARVLIANGKKKTSRFSSKHERDERDIYIGNSRRGGNCKRISAPDGPRFYLEKSAKKSAADEIHSATFTAFIRSVRRSLCRDKIKFREKSAR